MARVDIPTEGYYRRRLVKNGPWVGIWIRFRASQEDRSPVWIAECDGKFVDVWSVWPECSGEPIDEAEYNFLVLNAQWTRDFAPHEPEANPRKPVDINRIAPIF